MRPYTHSYAERLKRYRAEPEACNACPLKPECTPAESGGVPMRGFDEELLERVRAYRGTAPYEKALRKRKVWVEPMFAEAEEWHGMRRLGLRTLWRVNAEAMVTAAGQNVKRLPDFRGRGPRKSAQVEAPRLPVPTSSAKSRLHRGGHRRRSTPLLVRFSTGWPFTRSSPKLPFGYSGTFVARQESAEGGEGCGEVACAGARWHRAASRALAASSPVWGVRGSPDYGIRLRLGGTVSVYTLTVRPRLKALV